MKESYTTTIRESEDSLLLYYYGYYTHIDTHRGWAVSILD